MSIDILLVKEQLDAILEDGRLTPAAKNFHERHIYMVQFFAGLAKLTRLLRLLCC